MAVSSQDKVVLCYGHFNTIHAGHLRYLRYAQSLGDCLIIALRGDRKDSNYSFTQSERFDALELLGIGTRIIKLNEDDIAGVIEDIRPDTILLGSEFKESEWIKDIEELAKENECRIMYHSGNTEQVSDDLIGSDERSISVRRKAQFIDALERQGITKERMNNAVQKMKRSKILVIGDTIIDQFAACDALGLSAEAPVVVVKELKCEDFVGGAAIVASHISRLGCKCTFLSVVGEDKEANIARSQLEDWEVNSCLVSDSSRPTTFKKRYVVGNQKMFRVSRLEDRDIDLQIENQLIERLRALGPECDGIVVSDFNYGVITERVLAEISLLKKKYGLKLFGDSQSSSQVGDLERLVDFTLLTPNEKEARIAYRSKNLGIEQLAHEIMSKSSCEELIMKLGPDGFISYSRDNSGGITNQPFPALTANPVDVAGAGDSLLAVMAAGLCSGEKTMLISAIACCMTAIAVNTMGNKPISSEKLLEYINELLV